MKKVAVIMGSDSDWPVVKSACRELEGFGIPLWGPYSQRPPHSDPGGGVCQKRPDQRLWRADLRRGDGGASGGGLCGQLHFAGDRYSHEGWRHGRTGRPSRHGSDARRYPGGDRGHQRSEKCSGAGCADFSGLRRRTSARLDEARSAMAAQIAEKEEKLQAELYNGW